MPTLLTRYSPGSEERVRSAAAIAIPVGVTISPAIAVVRRGMEYAWAMFNTAGTGTGSSPCWQRTNPVPSVSPVTTQSVMPRSSIKTEAATMSTMDSTAPTS